MSDNKALPIELIGVPTPVGGGYSVQFIAQLTGDYKLLIVDCLWEPRMPSSGAKSSKIQRACYDNAKARFFQVLLKHLGNPTGVAP